MMEIEFLSLSFFVVVFDAKLNFLSILAHSANFYFLSSLRRNGDFHNGRLRNDAFWRLLRDKSNNRSQGFSVPSLHAFCVLSGHILATWAQQPAATHLIVLRPVGRAGVDGHLRGAEGLQVRLTFQFGKLSRKLF
jgi:hypothetical protein